MWSFSPRPSAPIAMSQGTPLTLLAKRRVGPERCSMRRRTNLMHGETSSWRPNRLAAGTQDSHQVVWRTSYPQENQTFSVYHHPRTAWKDALTQHQLSYSPAENKIEGNRKERRKKAPRRYGGSGPCSATRQNLCASGTMCSVVLMLPKIRSWPRPTLLLRRACICLRGDGLPCPGSLPPVIEVAPVVM